MNSIQVEKAYSFILTHEGIGFLTPKVLFKVLAIPDSRNRYYIVFGHALLKGLQKCSI